MARKRQQMHTTKMEWKRNGLRITRNPSGQYLTAFYLSFMSGITTLTLGSNGVKARESRAPWRTLRVSILCPRSTHLLVKKRERMIQALSSRVEGSGCRNQAGSKKCCAGDSLYNSFHIWPSYARP